MGVNLGLDRDKTSMNALKDISINGMEVCVDRGLLREASSLLRQLSNRNPMDSDKVDSDARVCAERLRLAGEKSLV